MVKRTQKTTMWVATVLVPLTMPLVSLAATHTLAELLKNKVLILVNPIIGIITGLALMFFIWGLAKFILKAGDEKGREEGKKVMLWGIIALFVMVSVWGIVKILQKSIFDEELPSPAPFSFKIDSHWFIS